MSFTDWITGFDRDNYEAGLAADRANAARNAKLLEQGKISDADFRVSQERFDAAQRYDPDAEIEAAWDEGLQDGANNVTAVLSKPFEIAGTAVGSVLKALPWWLWLAAIAAGAVYFWPVIRPLVSGLAKRR